MGGLEAPAEDRASQSAASRLVAIVAAVVVVAPLFISGIKASVAKRASIVRV